MGKLKNPPDFSVKLIKWLCRDELIEEIQGNLFEYHQQLPDSKISTIQYWFQVITYLRPSTLRTVKTNKTRPMMIINTKLTIRNLYKHRSTVLLNFLGFTIGLVATFFLYFYIYAEVETDSFHVDQDKIYRVLRVSDINGTPYRIGVTSAPYGPALLNDYPQEISDMVRIGREDGLVSVGEKKFYEDELAFADANFFEFFSFPLAVGEKSSVLSTSNSVVLSHDAALKYFGEENPIGKILEVDNEYQFMVSGVMAPLPTNVHLDFSMVFSIDLLAGFSGFTNWWNNNYNTYLKIPDPQDAARMEGTLADFMIKYMGDEFKKSGRIRDMDLEPLRDIYFNKDTRYDYASHGNAQSIKILIMVAMAVLFIACFNYVNLSIAQSFLRAKEVGMKKILGGSKGRLILQFLSETTVILLFSIAFSIAICELLLPVFNQYFGLDVNLFWLDPNVLKFIGLLILLILLSSGLYPAYLLASYRPISILRGGKSASQGRSGLRKGLVVFQFTTSIFLIVATLLIYIQTNYLQSKDLGFDKEAIVLIDLNNSEIRQHRKVFKERLLENSNILGLTSFSGEPGGFHDASTFKISGLTANPRMRTLFTDPDFFNVLGIDVVAGRGYSSDIASDEEYAVLMNETAVRELGLTNEEIIGRKITMPVWDISNVSVIGVVSDYHFLSLHQEIEPLSILCGGGHRKMAIKINMNQRKESLLFVDEVFKELASGYSLEYQFFDDQLNLLYEKEVQQARLFSSFSGLSIFLACLGIFGLAAYSARRRQKELGIRKVLGATANQIISMISGEFVRLVMIATLVAIPISWYFIKKWLAGYAYSIDMLDHWYIFFVGGILSVVVALFTVILKTYRAAVSNPTESIRDE